MAIKPGDYIPTEDLPNFVRDPLQEEERARTDVDWQNVKICRFCRLAATWLYRHLIRKHPSDVRALFLKHFPHRANEWDRLSDAERLIGYKKEFGYNKNDGLTCANDSERRSQIAVRITRKARHRGKRLVDRRLTKAVRVRATANRQRTIREYGCSPASRKRRSIAARNQPFPTRWAYRCGKVVTDWMLAQLRLRGLANYDIAKKVGMRGAPVCRRLKRIGFTSRGRYYYRGEAVTEKHFRETPRGDASRSSFQGN